MLCRVAPLGKEAATRNHAFSCFMKCTLMRRLCRRTHLHFEHAPIIMTLAQRLLHTVPKPAVD